MRVFFKYLFGGFGVIVLLSYALLTISVTQGYLYKELSIYLSKITKNRIIIEDINLSNYPLLSIDAKINNRSKIHLVGSVNLRGLDMNYTLYGDSFAYNQFVLDERIDFRGNIHGDYQYLLFNGEGKIDNHHNQSLGEITIHNGSFDIKHQHLLAHYHLHIDELSYLEPYLHHRYRGEFESDGTIESNHKDFVIQGKTGSFEGDLHYLYVPKSIKLNLKGVSLVKLLEQYGSKALLSAKIFGKVEYIISEKATYIDTKLKEAHFRKSNITDTIQQTTGINLLSHQYNKSSFVGKYKNGKLLADIKIDDGKNHLYFNQTTIESRSKKLNAQFELKMRSQEFHGKLYGTLHNPKLSLNLSKLLKYQIDRELGTLLNANQKEELKRGIDHYKDQLKEVNIDEVKEQAKDFLKKFF
jgi:hypothetical protein